MIVVGGPGVALHLVRRPSAGDSQATPGATTRPSHQPLRHEYATEDQREEEMVEACMDTILALEPRPSFGTSGREVIKRLREAANEKGRKGYRDATVREAWHRISGREAGDDA